jgi:predicted DsbA family dithiol-disulfide isomerase
MEDLIGYAAELGLDTDRFVEDIADEALLERLRRDVLSAEEGGVRGTPTFFIGDRRHIGPFDAVTLIDVLEQAASRQPS